MGKFSIHNCHEWSLDEMARYGRDLGKAMAKLRDRFPDDVDLQELGRDILAGKRQLWLILDGEARFVAFVTGEIEITKRGRKRLLLLELGGEGGEALVDMIVEIEAWARDEGVDEICPIGRMGWVRALKSRGYRADVVKFKKDL